MSRRGLGPDAALFRTRIRPVRIETRAMRTSEPFTATASGPPGDSVPAHLPPPYAHRVPTLGLRLGHPTDARGAPRGQSSTSSSNGGNVMKIVVIGGSGRIGSNVVRRLSAQGHDPVPASPNTGVDTITGEGLAEVMMGADVVVDVANAPVWDDDAVLEFFTTSTRNVLAAERDAGVGHHVAVSIVGADRLPDSGYLRAKVAQEAEVEAGGVAYTILRSTQFFEVLP